ncbi:MAG: class I SAM-dependent methyltransferase [Pseudomonadales bacterium]
MANSPSQCLSRWLRSPLGERLLEEEAACLGEAARRFHGDTLLWAGCHEQVAQTVRGCMVRHRLYASAEPADAVEDLSRLQCSLDALPLPNNSLDAMVLHHALETCPDPRGGLREAARVLVPGGRLVICAFNPLSLWGLRRAYARLCNDAFSGLRLVTSLRLLDWLALLGFEPHGQVRYLSYSLPFYLGDAPRPQSGRVGRALSRLQPPVGGVYVIVVTKQAAALRPHWRTPRVKSPSLVPAAYPKSAVQREPAPVLYLRDWKDLGRND